MFSSLTLALSTMMVTTTVIIHFLGLLVLLRLLDHQGTGLKPHESLTDQAILLIFVVLGLVFIHAVQIWAYAILYLELHALPDFEQALYFSTTAFTTVGFGDVVLQHQWRIIGAIEAANGFILFGCSIAFLMSMTVKLRTLEHDWLERKWQTAASRDLSKPGTSVDNRYRRRRHRHAQNLNRRQPFAKHEKGNEGRNTGHQKNQR
jgi:Ion channel